MRDGYEAYIEIECDWGRMCGGDRKEIEAYWEGLKEQTSAFATRLVLQDGTVSDKRPAGSAGLTRRLRKRLSATFRAQDASAQVKDDTALIQELAVLLRINTE